MKRTIAFAVTVLVFGACDTGREIIVSRQIPGPLERTCVVEALRMEKTVREAGVGATGLIYAILTIPEPLKSPEPDPDVGVDEERNDKGELEVKFSLVWVGSAGSPEYRAYVQKVIEDLRDITIKKCGGK